MSNEYKDWIAEKYGDTAEADSDADDKNKKKK